jgi:NADPH-dependent 2,4-dienoyl-CoA reductase/sulfur reductase-like enzyme
MTLSRREFIKRLSAAGSAAALPGCAGMQDTPAIGRVVVIGGGYSGATAAKYIRLWSPDIAVTLVEREPVFISCPLSNLVLGGSRTLADISVGYDGLHKRGIDIVRDTAIAIDPANQQVRLQGGSTLRYDRLIVAPGVDFMFDQVAGLSSVEAQTRVLHAWKAGPQTVALRQQLEAMRNGGVYALHIPIAPYRCPPGPYERACQVAHYFKQAKPQSKVLILDANPDVVSKKGLFMAAWNGRYQGIVEYRPNSELLEVDSRGLTVKLLGGDVKADVLNIVPPQRAGAIAESAGLITANNRWCEIDWLSYESKASKNIHVLGDATLSAPAMPKSGHIANQQAKVCAAAIIALMHNQPVNELPVFNNTCYSFIDDREVMHVASVHRYDAGKKTMLPVEGSGGLSSAPSVEEGAYAQGWARNIWSDMLG